jgi:hypothetical protein
VEGSAVEADGVATLDLTDNRLARVHVKGAKKNVKHAEELGSRNHFQFSGSSS